MSCLPQSLLLLPPHEHIIPLYDVFLPPTTRELHIVFECMEGNLYQLTKTRKGRPLASGLVVAVMSSALPYSLEMVALRRLDRQAFGVMMSLEPAIASLAALALLGERLSPVQWFAIACVIAASVGITARSRPRPVPAAP